MEIKALILTNEGLEKISAQEAKQYGELLSIKPGVVIIQTTKIKLAELTYYGRTINKTIEIKKEFQASTLEEIREQTKEVITEDMAGVECERKGTHPFTSFDVQQEIARNIKTPNFKNPNIKYFILIQQNECYFGIDYAGIDLGKRDYRLFLGRDSLRGNIAAALLKIADYRPKNILLDPYCRHGEIVIEAALMGTKTSVNKFIKDKLAFTKFMDIDLSDGEDKALQILASDEQFGNVSSAKKNAKISGANKKINFSRQEIEWLDTKLEAVDKIVTMPIQPAQSNEKRIDKMYEQFFNMANELLTGRMVLCMKRGKELILKHATNFKFEQEYSIMQGREQLSVLVIKR